MQPPNREIKLFIVRGGARAGPDVEAGAGARSGGGAGARVGTLCYMFSDKTYPIFWVTHTKY